MTALEPLSATHGVSREALFSAHAPYVWRVVRYLGVADREVEDVAQEVFLRAFEKLDRYDPAQSALRSWLYGFCVGVVANHRRLRRHQREVLGQDADERGSEGAPDQESLVVAKQARAQLLTALDALSEDHRTVTVLHAIEELPMPEVARLLGIPVQTAYSRYQVARTELRRALERAARPRRSS
ncbi:MAG: sigma-70 family RNA polymerase sigma factor [Sandaracinaceae bacterium]|nr:sigma-70 family RNA polymerase sigma factor [Sandaracinaceae bacterium]